MKILVLGGGRQGRIITEDLRTSLPTTPIQSADVRPDAADLQADLSDPTELVRLMGRFDLVVCALPSALGFRAMRAAIESRRNLVDLSFCPEDALSLDTDARRAGVFILPDSGLAPGLSNLLVGSALSRGPVDEASLEVGGVAADPKRPFGYVITWSVEDLHEEYTRPARILREGRVTEVPALSGRRIIEVPGVGALESFYTDGLRSLLHCGIRDMEERTLRWPGHVDAVIPLLERGTLVETLRRDCSAPPPEDLVVLRARFRRGARWEETLLVDRFDGRRTAMSRTTALTCAAIARLAAQGGLSGKTGVLPLETLGRDPRIVTSILGDLSKRGVVLKLPA